MTTSHRPTWNSLKGSNNPGGVRTIPSTSISKQVHSNLGLKRRDLGINNQNKHIDNNIHKEILKNKEGLLAGKIKLKIQENKVIYPIFNNFKVYITKMQVFIIHLQSRNRPRL